jgi:hypothetical protein
MVESTVAERLRHDSAFAPTAAPGSAARRAAEQQPVFGARHGELNRRRSCASERAFARRFFFGSSIPQEYGTGSFSPTVDTTGNSSPFKDVHSEN